MTQAQALAILETGKNVFLTGEPGAGKTYTMNAYAARLRDQGVEPAMTASTGIAATHIGGMTIHSWSGIGIKTTLDKYELNDIASRRYIAKRVRKAAVLVIDEVSMLLPQTLSMVDAVCRKIKKSSSPFGGIQIIFVGDFFQLPPITRAEATHDAQGALLQQSMPRFAYDSSAWADANPVVCYLTEQHRQDDEAFLSLLSAIRCNTFTGEHLSRLETRKISGDQAPEGIPKLFSHNANVDRVNDEILGKIRSTPRVFDMESRGPDPMVAALKRGCLSPEALTLKVGAAVMCTKNNPKEGFVNGTLGMVRAFDDESGYPIITMRDGKNVQVQPMDWVVEEDGMIRAQITQLPLRLAWAITVHKSQGMSFDAAVMDLSSVFEFGQGYVALSRIRRLSGLYLLGWNTRAFEVHPEVLAKDGAFRNASQQAEAQLV